VKCAVWLAFFADMVEESLNIFFFTLEMNKTLSLSSVYACLHVTHSAVLIPAHL